MVLPFGLELHLRAEEFRFQWPNRKWEKTAGRITFTFRLRFCHGFYPTPSLFPIYGIDSAEHSYGCCAFDFETIKQLICESPQNQRKSVWSIYETILSTNELWICEIDLGFQERVRRSKSKKSHRKNWGQGPKAFIRIFPTPSPHFQIDNCQPELWSLRIAAFCLRSWGRSTARSSSPNSIFSFGITTLSSGSNHRPSPSVFVYRAAVKKLPIATKAKAKNNRLGAV